MRFEFGSARQVGRKLAVVPPIYEKFSDQVPNWSKVVPWQKGQYEPLTNQLS